MFDLSRAQKTAHRLIQENGAAVTLVDTRVAAYDPLNPHENLSAVQECSGFATFLPLSDSALIAMDTVISQENPSSKTGKQVFLSSFNLAFPPAFGMNIVVGGVPYAIESVTPLAPNHTFVVFYRLRVRDNPTFSVIPTNVVAFSGVPVTFNGSFIVFTL